MDADRFDWLARLLGGQTRRWLLRTLAGLSLAGALGPLAAGEAAAADGRRRRRKKRHKHGQGPPRNRKGRGKKRRKQKDCPPEPKSVTCAGGCGNAENNCGKEIDCSAVCQDPPNATGACLAGGSCEITCNEGFAACDGNFASGCETNLLTDSSNCGVCGKRCICPVDGDLLPCQNGSCWQCNGG